MEKMKAAAKRWGTAAFLAAAAAGAWAAPYIPATEDTIVERLPGRRTDAREAELRRMRAALQASPQDDRLAAELALMLFERAMADGDPRYVGYAAAAVRPWDGTDAPIDVLFVRGLIRQYRHDFAGSLADLGTVVRRDPAHVAARSWRAAIFMVQADYESAARECEALAGHALALRAAGCRAYLAATTGHARAAYAELSRALAGDAGAAPGMRLWALTRLAEIAWRVGDHDSAERHFREALALKVDDNFLLAAYADFLLERGRPRAVVDLLKAWERSDTLLLRLALAERALGLPQAKAHARALEERFTAAALRGERLHQAEEARFLLELKRDPKAALAVAAENWKHQREPRDAQVLLEAAAAAGDRKAAEPVLRWLGESRFEDPRLQRLAASLP
jgi:Tfp pilus assembly protein PilF